MGCQTLPLKKSRMPKTGISDPESISDDNALRLRSTNHNPSARRMLMEEREIKFHSGTQIWKSHLEYFNDQMFIHGFPFYRINKVQGVYYLWELDREDPDSMKYNILKKSTDFDVLYEEGMELQDKTRMKLFPEDKHI